MGLARAYGAEHADGGEQDHDDGEAEEGAQAELLLTVHLGAAEDDDGEGHDCVCVWVSKGVCW